MGKMKFAQRAAAQAARQGMRLLPGAAPDDAGAAPGGGEGEQEPPALPYKAIRLPSGRIVRQPCDAVTGAPLVNQGYYLHTPDTDFTRPPALRGAIPTTINRAMMERIDGIRAQDRAYQLGTPEWSKPFARYLADALIAHDAAPRHLWWRNPYICGRIRARYGPTVLAAVAALMQADALAADRADETIYEQVARAYRTDPTTLWRWLHLVRAYIRPFYRTARDTSAATDTPATDDANVLA